MEVFVIDDYTATQPATGTEPRNFCRCLPGKYTHIIELPTRPLMKAYLPVVSFFSSFGACGAGKLEGLKF